MRCAPLSINTPLASHFLHFSPSSGTFSLLLSASLSNFVVLALRMSSGGSGKLSRVQKGKAVARATESSPAHVVVSNSPSDFETIHREAMMDTENMDTPQRFLVADSARQFREERESAALILRDGLDGASDGEVSLPDFIPCCYHPGGIFEDLPALAAEQMRSPVVEGESWENVEETRSTPSSVKALLRKCGGAGVTFLIPTKSQRPWSPPLGFQCV